MPKVKLFNQEDVLQKAMELFWKSGYHATSIQDLVNHLGINRASLYDTYGGKKKLFDQSLELYCNTNREGMRQLLKSQDSVKQGFRKIFETAIAYSTTDIDRKGCFVVNSITELIPGDDPLKKALIKNRTSFVDIYYEFLLSGQQSGEISKDKDIRSIASLIYTLFSGIKVIGKIEPDHKNLLSSVDSILSLLD